MSCKAFLAATLLLGSDQVFCFRIPTVVGLTERLGLLAHRFKLQLSFLVSDPLFQRSINSISFTAVLIGLPTGIWACGLSTGLLVDGGSLIILFFRSAGNRRCLEPFELVSDCVIGEAVGGGCCRLLGNPVVVGLLGVLRAWVD